MYKRNKRFQISKDISRWDDWIICMKYLFLVTFVFGLSTLSEAVTIRMFKVLDTCVWSNLNEKTALVAIKDLKLKYEGKNASEAELFFKLYNLVFTWDDNLDF